MATPQRRGPEPLQQARPTASIADLVRDEFKRVLGTVRESDLPKKALGYGDMENGSTVGIQNAVAAKVRLNGVDTQYDVIHALGAVPVSCKLEHAENSNGSPAHISAAPLRREEWTATVARVDIVLISGGSLDGVTATFIVKGA